ncbi:hypothetical protein LTR95_007289 [Oleoguttula sp. CCFEE 5521]
MALVKRLFPRSPRASPLLQLPPELRIIIFEILFEWLLEELPFIPRRYCYPLPPIFRVCRTLRNEAFQPWMKRLQSHSDQVSADRAKSWTATELAELPFTTPARYVDAWRDFVFLLVWQKQLTTLELYSTSVRSDGPGSGRAECWVTDWNISLRPWPRLYPWPPMSLGGRSHARNEFDRRVEMFLQGLEMWAPGSVFAWTADWQEEEKTRRPRRRVAARSALKHAAWCIVSPVWLWRRDERLHSLDIVLVGIFDDMAEQ